MYAYLDLPKDLPKNLLEFSPNSSHLAISASTLAISSASLFASSFLLSFASARPFTLNSLAVRMFLGVVVQNCLMLVGISRYAGFFVDSDAVDGRDDIIHGATTGGIETKRELNTGSCAIISWKRIIIIRNILDVVNITLHQGRRLLPV